MLNALEVDADQEKSIAGSDLPLRTVLAALASILRDSTGRFEETSDRIAQLVVARETGTGVDIIVALQSAANELRCPSAAKKRCFTAIVEQKSSRTRVDSAGFQQPARPYVLAMTDDRAKQRSKSRRGQP